MAELARPGSERRHHRRLEIELPIECRTDGGKVVRTITRNVSTGGLYLDLDSPDFAAGDQFELELTIPAAEGIWPYPGQAQCRAEVIRVDRGTWKSGATRYGIAARFLGKLRFSY